jgi:hypothetical protein
MKDKNKIKLKNNGIVFDAGDGVAKDRTTDKALPQKSAQRKKS